MSKPSIQIGSLFAANAANCLKVVSGFSSSVDVLQRGCSSPGKLDVARSDGARKNDEARGDAHFPEFPMPVLPEKVHQFQQEAGSRENARCSIARAIETSPQSR